MTLLTPSSIDLYPNVWYLDFEVSNHMTSRKNLFIEIDEKIHGAISFGDLSKVPIQGLAAYPST